MGAGAQIPLWVAVVIAVGSPLLASAGVLAAQGLTPKFRPGVEGAVAPEETMRMIRWAADLAASCLVPRSKVGLAALDALDESEMLQADDQGLISAVLTVLLASEVAAYHGGDRTEEV